MAKFKFTADGSEGANNFDPVPDNAYVLGVTTCELKRTSTSKNMLELELAIDEGPYIGRKVWTNIVFNPKGAAGHGLTVQALKAFGFDADGSLDIDTDEWIGRTCRANLTKESYVSTKDGKTKWKNVIPTAGYITEELAAKPAPTRTTPKPAPKKVEADIEEVPF